MLPKTTGVVQMVGTLRLARSSVAAARRCSARDVPGPFMSLLVGAGCSISAGMPSTPHLVRALQYFRRHPEEPWHLLFDKTVDATSEDPVEDYPGLVEKVLALPAARQGFITSAVRWASQRRAPVSEESVLLSAILCASTLGDVPLTDRIRLGLIDEAPMARCLSRHVFTTNFDDVLPLAFHLAGRPVEVLDAGMFRHAERDASYPTIVYLHGRHLHYDLRNTRGELADMGRPQAAFEDPRLQFRRLLKSTGLLIVGYSGGNDGVMDQIESALGDADSLPFGLWWSPYPCKEALTERARIAIESSDKAHYLEPGRDAEHLLRALAHEVGIQEAVVLSDWLQETKHIGEAVEAISRRTPVRLLRFLADVQKTLAEGEEESIQRLLKRWPAASADFATVDEDPSLVGDAYSAMDFVHFLYGNHADGVETASRALAAYQQAGDLAACAVEEHALGLALPAVGDLQGSEEHLRKSIELFTQLHDDKGVGMALGTLSAVLSEMGRWDEAFACLQEKLAIHERLGDKGGVASSLGELGELHKKVGDIEEAERLLREALGTARETGEPSEIGELSRNLADLLMEQERWSDADAAYLESIEAYDSSGMWAAAAGSRIAYSEVLMATKRLFDAEQVLTNALQAGRRHARKETVHFSAVKLGIVLAALDRPTEATPLLMEGVASRDPNDTDAFDIFSLAVGYKAADKLDLAVRELHHAERMYVEGERWSDAAEVATTLADWLVRMGRVTEAAPAEERAAQYTRRAGSARVS